MQGNPWQPWPQPRLAMASHASVRPMAALEPVGKTDENNNLKRGLEPVGSQIHHEGI